jgi:hypothetical protein
MLVYRIANSEEPHSHFCKWQQYKCFNTVLPFSLHSIRRVFLEKLAIANFWSINYLLLWNPNVHYCGHKSPTLDPMLSQMNSYYSYSIFCKIYFSMIRTGTAQLYSSGLRDEWPVVLVPAGSANFSLYHCFQTGSGAHPASYPMNTRGSSPDDKAAWAWRWPLTST